MIGTVEDEATEPLHTGRPVLSHRLNIAALTLLGTAGVALAVMVDMPTLVPELWIWGVIAAAVALGATCAIVSLNVRPQLTAAGRIAAIDQQMASLGRARAALAGVKPDLDETDRAAIAALADQVRADGAYVPGSRKPRPGRRGVPTTV
jgi:hypothetical protein